MFTPQACHGADLPVMVFIHGPSQAELELATIGGFGGPIYDDADVDPYLDIDVPNQMGMGLRTQQCDFWDQWIP